MEATASPRRLLTGAAGSRAARALSPATGATGGGPRRVPTLPAPAGLALPAAGPSKARRQLLRSLCSATSPPARPLPAQDTPSFCPLPGPGDPKGAGCGVSASRRVPAASLLPPLPQSTPAVSRSPRGEAERCLQSMSSAKRRRPEPPPQALARCWRRWRNGAGGPREARAGEGLQGQHRALSLGLRALPGLGGAGPEGWGSAGFFFGGGGGWGAPAPAAPQGGDSSGSRGGDFVPKVP